MLTPWHGLPLWDRLQSARHYPARVALSVALIPVNQTGVLPWVRQDYALSIVCALSLNLLGAGAPVDLFFCLLSSCYRPTRLWLRVRELYFLAVCTAVPRVLNVYYGVDPVAYSTLVLLLAGRLPWYFALW